MTKDTTKRFTDRVANYIRYRPDYPTEVIALLLEKTALSSHAAVADIGAGTGIFTKHLLDTGAQVYAVEPNDEMRQAADSMLKDYANYHSVRGTAEDTTLPDSSADLIVCAQAFHWFNNAETKTEFQRLLKAGGHVVLIWNNRVTDADEFAAAYDSLLQQKSTDYNEVNHQKLSQSDFTAFFKDGEYELVSYANAQHFDKAGLIGRAASSSYVPAPDTEEGKLFLAELNEVFDKYQVDGSVSFQYNTDVYIGKV